MRDEQLLQLAVSAALALALLAWFDPPSRRSAMYEPYAGYDPGDEMPQQPSPTPRALLPSGDVALNHCPRCHHTTQHVRPRDHARWCRPCDRAFYADFARQYRLLDHRHEGRTA